MVGGYSPGGSATTYRKTVTACCHHNSPQSRATSPVQLLCHVVLFAPPFSRHHPLHSDDLTSCTSCSRKDADTLSPGGSAPRKWQSETISRELRFRQYHPPAPCAAVVLLVLLTFASMRDMIMATAKPQIQSCFSGSMVRCHGLAGSALEESQEAYCITS